MEVITIDNAPGADAYNAVAAANFRSFQDPAAFCGHASHCQNFTARFWGLDRVSTIGRLNIKSGVLAIAHAVWSLSWWSRASWTWV